MFNPSACRPAIAPIRGQTPPTMIGGGGSGRPGGWADHLDNTVKDLVALDVWPMAACSTASECDDSRRRQAPKEQSSARDRLKHHREVGQESWLAIGHV